VSDLTLRDEVRAGNPVSAEPSASPIVSHRHTATWVCVAAFTGLNLALSLHALTGRSIWLDEADSWYVSAQHIPKLISYAGWQGNMELYDAVLHFVISIFGSSAFALRAPSAVFGAAAIPVVFLIGRHIGGARCGLVASALSSVSLPLILWSEYARAYSMGTLLACGSVLAFLKAVESPTTRNFVIWTVVSAALTYTLTLGLFVLAAQLGSLVFLNPRLVPWRKVLASSVAIALFDVPLTYVVIRDGTGQIAWIPPASLDEIRSIVDYLLGAVNPRVSLAEVAMGALCLGGLAVGVWALVRYGRSRVSWRLILILCWLVVPVLIGTFVSLTSQPLLYDRYFLTSVPAAVLLSAFVLSRFPVVIAVALAAAIFAGQLVGLPSMYARTIGNFQAAASYIFTHDRSGDCITFEIQANEFTYEYFLTQWGHGHAITSTPRWTYPSIATTTDVGTLGDELQATEHQNGRQILVRAQGCGRVWLVVWGTLVGSDRNVRSRLESAYGPPLARNYDGVTVDLFRH